MTDRSEVVREARELIAAARALVSEWSEEGLDAFDPNGARGAGQGGRGAEGEVEALAGAPRTDRTAQPASVDPARTDPPTAPADAEPPPSEATTTRPPGLTLEAVREELGECTRCGLHAGRRTIVFGDGNPDADILFVGEGPGQSEDEQGLPFVGRAGELLTQMIEKGMGLARSDVYICNIVKCRPPRNRTPLPDEVAACRPFLDGQIEAVRPKVIVALGKPATGLLLGREVAITRIRGTWHDYEGIPLMPTLHPAYILRQYTPENRRAVWEDLKAVVARVEEDTR
jgi:DNA polymerase